LLILLIAKLHIRLLLFLLLLLFHSLILLKSIASIAVVPLVLLIFPNSLNRRFFNFFDVFYIITSLFISIIITLSLILFISSILTFLFFLRLFVSYCLLRELLHSWYTSWRNVLAFINFLIISHLI